MMKWKKLITFGCCTLLLTASLTACSGGSASKESSFNSLDQTDGNSDNKFENFNADSMIFGKVTAINGKEITLALGDMPQGGGMPGEMGNGPKGDGTKGDGIKGDGPKDVPQTDGSDNPSSDDGKQDDGSDVPDPSGMPQGGEAKGDRPNGDMPRGMGGDFKENGETLTITIEDESLIQIQKGRETSTGTLSDIVVDGLLIIQYADDNTISAVIIQSRNMDAPQNDEKDTKNETEEVQ